MKYRNVGLYLLLLFLSFFAGGLILPAPILEDPRLTIPENGPYTVVERFSSDYLLPNNDLTIPHDKIYLVLDRDRNEYYLCDWLLYQPEQQIPSLRGYARYKGILQQITTRDGIHEEEGINRWNAAWQDYGRRQNELIRKDYWEWSRQHRKPIPRP